MSKSTKGFAGFYFAGCCLLMILGFVVPSGHGPVLVFGKPWGASAIEVVAKAEGRIIFLNDATWVALTDATGSEFIANLYKSGAGFVASSAVAYACARLTGVDFEETK
ncbi:MAG: hypothetical protein ABJL55_01785 [Roseibium sp.]